MSIINSAPICVFAFNRPKQLEKLLISLSSCTGSKDSVVYIFIDGGRDPKEHSLCEESYFVAQGFSCFFKDVQVELSKSNKGLAQSLKSGISLVLNTYSTVIVLEDDLEVSENFISFMNQALESYKYTDKVGSISGFSVELMNNTLKDTYLHPRPCSWGWATWKDRWEKCDWNYKPESYYESFSLRLNARKAGEDVYRMFKNNQKGKINSWAIMWTVHHIRNGLTAVYPFQSKVKNNGFGESATHCSGRNPFPTNFKPDNELSFIFEDDTILKKYIVKQANYYHSNFYKLMFKLGLR